MLACAVPALISLVAALATAAVRSPAFTFDNLANTDTLSHYHYNYLLLIPLLTRSHRGW